MKDLYTGQLLCIYFGIDGARGMKKKKVLDELVRRGVGVRSLEWMLRDMMGIIGSAADNRIPEIDEFDPEEEA